MQTTEQAPRPRVDHDGRVHYGRVTIGRVLHRGNYTHPYAAKDRAGRTTHHILRRDAVAHLVATWTGR